MLLWTLKNPNKTLKGLHQFLVQANWQKGKQSNDPQELGQSIEREGFEEIFFFSMAIVKTEEKSIAGLVAI
jgi:hypothetical protein